MDEMDEFENEAFLNIDQWKKIWHMDVAKVLNLYTVKYDTKLQAQNWNKRRIVKNICIFINNKI